MEDRSTPGLLLEMTDLDLADYTRRRVPDVLGRPGVRRATWWTNARRDRTDLPRTLPEFSHLGVYEVDDGFEAGEPPPGVAARHYRRTPRPGQGSLTGRPTDGLLLVLVSPRDPSGAQALRDWADFVHLRHIAESGVPGYAMITPYEEVHGGTPRFLHFYELCTDDPEGTFKSMTPRVIDRLGGGPGHPPFDEWAGHPQLVIDYVSTFRLEGARSA